METNKKKKILIVDDEPDVIEFLSYNFIKNGYEVDGAGTGMDGIEKVKIFLPDLIIADIMMPDMDGIIMCKILKSHDTHKDIPLIFLSATQDEYQAMNAGMSGDDYVSKPVRFSILLPMVEKHLSNSTITTKYE
ncbi:MAG TPA: response regulator [Bacteroidia bacterium]|nr:response regulator [Bacteroidia bacterium]